MFVILFVSLSIYEVSRWNCIKDFSDILHEGSELLKKVQSGTIEALHVLNFSKKRSKSFEIYLYDISS